jgi:hypothetical protein
MEYNDQDFNQSLVKLQKELSRLKPAVQQIEELQKISKEVVSGMEGITLGYEKHLQLIIEDYNNRTETLHSSIEGERVHFRKDLEKMKLNVNESLTEILLSGKKAQDILFEQTEQQVSTIFSSIDTRVFEAQQIFLVYDSKVNQQLLVYESFVIKVNELIERINKVDFPGKFEIVDNSISGLSDGIDRIQNRMDVVSTSINTSVQNNSGRIDQLRNSINQLVDDIDESLDKKMTDFNEKFNWRTSILIALSIFNFGILLLLLIKKIL